jgi:flavin-dependent dehydrogenase
MHDAIVVGARCAGSPTAMLLARMGYRVLLVDRAGFPSDTLSTHYIHQPGVARLQRWGLLEPWWGRKRRRRARGDSTSARSP